MSTPSALAPAGRLEIETLRDAMPGGDIPPSSPASPLLSTRAANARSSTAIAVVILVSVVIFLALVPFAKEPLPAYPAFIPANQAILIVNDLVTAVLLFAHVRAARSRALLLLACGYTYSAVMAAIHVLTFPGVFGPSGLLGGGAQTTGYLFVFWHTGFVVFAMGYIFIRKNEQPTGAGASVGKAVALVICATAALAVLAIAGNDLFPPMLHEGRYTSTFNLGRFGQWILTALAIVQLWRSRPHSLLDQWLLVVLFNWFIEIGLVAIFNAGRYDVGFYAGRLYGSVSSCLVSASFSGSRQGCFPSWRSSGSANSR
jgi:hypothetical protein